MNCWEYVIYCLARNDCIPKELLAGYFRSRFMQCLPGSKELVDDLMKPRKRLQKVQNALRPGDVLFVLTPGSRTSISHALFWMGPGNEVISLETRGKVEATSLDAWLRKCPGHDINQVDVFQISGLSAAITEVTAEIEARDKREAADIEKDRKEKAARDGASSSSASS